MAQGVDEARRQVELTKDALAADLERAMSRVRHELDWKARLRRDAPQLIAVGVAVIAVGVGAVVLRRRFGRRDEGAVEDLGRVTLNDLASEVRALRREVERTGTRKGSDSFMRKVALGAVTAAAGAGGRMAASRIVQRSEAEQAASR